MAFPDAADPEEDLDTGLIRFRSVRDFADSFAGTWDLEYQQLGPADRNGFCRYAKDHTGLVYEERFLATIGLRGTVAAGLLAVHLTDACGRSGRWQGRNAPMSALAYADSGAELGVVIPRGTRNVVALIPLEAAHERVERLAGVSLSRLLPGGSLFHPLDPRRRSGLVEGLRTLLREPPHPGGLGLAITELLAQALDGVDGQTGVPGRSSWQLFRRAMARWEQGDPRVSPAELALQLGVSLRSLELAFRACMDVPPARYLRTLRLNRAHDLLLGMDPDEGFVGPVALDLGFFHLSRFAGDYRTLFGESPSETLGRRRPTRTARLPAVR